MASEPSRMAFTFLKSCKKHEDYAANLMCTEKPKIFTLLLFIFESMFKKAKFFFLIFELIEKISIYLS